jgi:hypothetical protein
MQRDIEPEARSLHAILFYLQSTPPANESEKCCGPYTTPLVQVACHK